MMMTLKQKYLIRVDENINQLSFIKKNMLLYIEAIKNIQNNAARLPENQGKIPNLAQKKENLEKSLEIFQQVFREIQDYKIYEMNQKLKDGFEEMVLNNQYFQVDKKLTPYDFSQVNAIMKNERKYTVIKQQNMVQIQAVPQPGQNNKPNFQIIIFISEIRAAFYNNGLQNQISYYSVQDLLVCPLYSNANEITASTTATNKKEIYIPHRIPQIFKEISNFAKIAQKKLDLCSFLEMFFPSAQQQRQQKQEYIQRVFSVQSECEICKTYLKFKSSKEGFVPPTILYNDKLYHFVCFKDNEFI